MDVDHLAVPMVGGPEIEAVGVQLGHTVGVLVANPPHWLEGQCPESQLYQQHQGDHHRQEGQHCKGQGPILERYSSQEPESVLEG